MGNFFRKLKKFTIWWDFGLLCICNQGMYQNDFLGVTFDNFVLNGVPTGPPITGEYVVKQVYEIDTNRSRWEDLAVVLGMVIGYRLIFFLTIKFTEDVGPLLRVLLTRLHRTCCYSLLVTHKAVVAHNNTIRPVSLEPSPVHEAVPLRYSMGKNFGH